MTAAAAIQAQQRSAIPASIPASKTQPAPMAASSGQDSSSAGTTSGSATITANDFLTLLVTEMQNQDPTANTDPNEYINQLVQVNSLQQLISINQVLSNSLGTGSTATSTTQSAGSSPPPRTPIAGAAASQPGTAAASADAVSGTANATAPPIIAGNLGVPASSASAQRLAHALDGSAPARTVSGLPGR